MTANIPPTDADTPLTRTRYLRSDTSDRARILRRFTGDLAASCNLYDPRAVAALDDALVELNTPIDRPYGHRRVPLAIGDRVIKRSRAHRCEIGTVIDFPRFNDQRGRYMVKFRYQDSTTGATRTVTVIDGGLMKVEDPNDE